MSNVPSFNYGGASIKSSADLANLSGESQSKVFAPGLHEVTISKVYCFGPAKNDPSWCNYGLSLNGVGEKTISMTIMVPTSDLVYGAKKSTRPFERLQRLMTALGVTLTPETVADVLPSYFGGEFISETSKNGNAVTVMTSTPLLGLALKIKTGYQGIRARRDGFEGNIVIDNGYGQLKADDKGNTLIFKDYEEVNAYALANNLSIAKFPEVIGFETSAGTEVLEDAVW